MPRKKTEFSDRYNDAFPSQLRKIIEETAKTQEEVAGHIGKKRQMVGNYCDGKTLPDVGTLTKLCEFFGVSADWLLGLSNCKERNGELAQIANYTGLSPRTIITLRASSEMQPLSKKINPLTTLIDKIAEDAPEGFLRYCNLWCMAQSMADKYDGRGISESDFAAMWWQYWNVMHPNASPFMDDKYDDSQEGVLSEFISVPDGFAFVPVTHIAELYVNMALRYIADCTRDTIQTIRETPNRFE